MKKMAITENNFFNNKQRILAFLRRNYINSKYIYSQDIQKELGIKKSYASSLISELERENLVKRDKEGKRKKICLTKKGNKFILFYLRKVLSDIEVNLLHKKVKFNY